MSILINKKTKVIVQGITGKEGLFHTKQMIDYGTKIVGGVTPGKGGTVCYNIPIFNTVANAKEHTNGNVSIIFVPCNVVKDAIIESIYSNINLIVCITEGIPVLDMIKIKSFIDTRSSSLIGPNCPGIISPNQSKVGIMPNNIFKNSGNIGIISRSGTLTYEVADQIINIGQGISTAVGIGGDPIVGMNIKDILKLFLNDVQTKCIVIIGEIGGNMEIDAIKWMNAYSTIKKPIISFIAGQTAPKGKIMGHAGAIIGKKEDTAQEKMKIMGENGVIVVKSLELIGEAVYKIINNKNK